MQKPRPFVTPKAAWPTAAHLVARWLDLHERLDLLMESLPGLEGAERGRCQHLVFGVVRHSGRIEAILSRLVAHPPRFVTRAVLYLAAFELIEASGEPADVGTTAKIVHHAVERAKELASPAEARLVNAVVRKMGTLIPSEKPPAAIAPASVLADYFSHPEWLVSRWLAEFGAGPTRKLLEWNQSPAPLYARWRDAALPVPEWLQPTEWKSFYSVASGHWREVEQLLSAGSLYIQDPGTRLSVELLAPKSGETVLDLCSAPGGKSLLIVDALGEGKIVAMDLPTARIDRLKENLSRTGQVGAALVQADILAGGASALKEHGLPGEYPAVLVDVPCSNSGVMRHRVDVKWRLQPADFEKHARQQGAMLREAAALVAPGGRLVYSTCSIDATENAKVVEAFVDRNRGFVLKKSIVALPWVDRHDGAGAFLLERI
ncbi:MAG TPA: RsmB/NOP family class I SAM-dependent RNA methyltransferase [Opitutaceae bacterium]|jgi:16S rRNA (cytosine967-C5)-methyltransferase|nr:RsmB/NOP family class I SAM-dependent RNA methyltransferase [Opitutaceae bacterium]